MTDLQLFFPPYSREFRYPELGIQQLAAYLTAKGFSVSQKDLNVLICALPIPAPPTPDPLRFWHPPAKKDSRLWNIKKESFQLGEVLKQAARPNPLYDKIYEKQVSLAAGGAALTGFSVQTIDQLLPALYFARRIRAQYPGAKICLGGPWVSASWESLPGWPELFDRVDFMIGFSGEVPLEKLLLHLKGRLSVSAVPNLARRVQGKVLRSPVLPGLPLEDLPPPLVDEADLPRYAARCLPYQTTRGCEWGRCVFCFHVFPGNRMECKSPAKIVREIKALSRRYKVRDFFLADLSTPVKLLEKISGGLGKIPVTWSALVRADAKFTKAFARKLRADGCDWLFFGLETTTPGSLRALHKGISLETLDANIVACGSAGIKVGLFILNYPGQPAAEFKRTLAYGVERAEFLAELAISRFEMGRWMADRPGLPGRIAAKADLDLNSFNVPYWGTGVSPEKFRELLGAAQVKFTKAKMKTRGI